MKNSVKQLMTQMLHNLRRNMNNTEKQQVTKLRTAGYSYGQIAKLLNMPRSTVSNFCLNNSIDSPDPPSIMREYRHCLNCHSIFVISNKHSRQFCSDKCRKEYWCKEKAQAESLSKEAEQQMTLKKGLDFLPNKSDELDDEKLPVVGLVRLTVQ